MIAFLTIIRRLTGERGLSRLMLLVMVKFWWGMVKGRGGSRGLPHYLRRWWARRRVWAPIEIMRLLLVVELVGIRVLRWRGQCHSRRRALMLLLVVLRISAVHPWIATVVCERERGGFGDMGIYCLGFYGFVRDRISEVVNSIAQE